MKKKRKSQKSMTRLAPAMGDVDDIDFTEEAFEEAQLSDADVVEKAEDVGYGHFGNYWNIKQEKLRAQSVPRELKSNIFNGVCIYVNGRTEPTQNELRDIICEHGGLHEYVLNRSTVTHIVATVLPTGKILQLGEKDIVVRPEWITESVKAGRRLDISPYRLYNQLDPRQSKLSFNAADNSEPSLKTSTRTAADPEFLKTYYQSSRLHHLSVWREELKRFASELMKSKLQKETKQSTNSHQYILHVDMDCFFASVSLIDRPDLHDKPVVIAHSAGNSDNKSSSDVSSCNYPARNFGIRNGIPLGRAKQMCPELIVLPYDFDKYNQVARELYKILANHADTLMAVSCDEAYLQVYLPESELMDFVRDLRAEIRSVCKCNASVGISTTVLLARLATKKAKPDNQYLISQTDCDQYIKELPIDDLPGVGWSLSERIANQFKAETCEQLQKIPLPDLQQEFGPAVGKMLWERCRGIDNRSFTEMAAEKPRKSVGTEVSWGVRLQDAVETERFVNGLCEQVAERLSGVMPSSGVPHRITVKVMIAQEGAGQPRKHLGHGICDSFSKSRSWNDRQVDCETKENIFDLAWPLLRVLIDNRWQQVRGIGIFLSDLRILNSDAVKKPTIAEFFANTSKQPSIEAQLERHGISIDVFKELPEQVQQDILREINTTVTAPKTPPKVHPPQTPPPKHKRNKRPSPSSQLTLTQLWQQKTRPTDDGQDEELPDGIDRDFLMALPSSIRQELIREAKEAPPRSPTKRKNRSEVIEGDLTVVGKNVDLVERLPITFEGLSTVSEILSVIDSQQDYDSLSLEAFLNGLVDYNLVEPLAVILGHIKDKHGRLVERIVNEYARRNDGKRLQFGLN